MMFILTDRQLAAILRRLDTMSAQMDNLQSAIANLETEIQKAVAKIDALKGMVDDPAAVQALADRVNAAQTALAAVDG